MATGDDDASSSDDDDDRLDLLRINRGGKGGKKKNAFAGFHLDDDDSSSAEEESGDDDDDEEVARPAAKTRPGTQTKTSSSSSDEDDNDDDEDEDDEKSSDEEVDAAVVDDELVVGHPDDDTTRPIFEFRDLTGRVTRHGSVIDRDVVDTILQDLMVVVGDVDEKKKSRPTEIQRECWTTLLSATTCERDVIAISKTGSGKTLAFLIPLLCGLVGRRRDNDNDANEDHGPPLDRPELLNNENGDAVGDAPSDTAAPLAAPQPSSSASIVSPWAIVLAPTRVLAQQIYDVAEKLVAKTPSLTGIKVSLVLGGASYHRQVQDLRTSSPSPDLIIATPGRLNSLCGRLVVVDSGEEPRGDDDHQVEERGGEGMVAVETMGTVIQLDRVGEVVIDEADMMLALGFQDDLSWFAQAMNRASAHRFRLVLTSATWEEPISATSVSLFQTISSAAHTTTTTEPVLLVADGAGQVVTKNVTQKVQVLSHKGAPRFKALLALLGAALQERDDENDDDARMIVFCLHKAEARQIGKDLHARGIDNVVLEGDMSQSARAAAVAAFRDSARGGRRRRVLVATDVAARGFDVPNISQVFNYSVGLSVESYIHRCGRTGRAGRFGVAHTFVVKGLDEKVTPELCAVLRQADQVVPDDLRILAAKELKRRQRQTTAATTPTLNGGAAKGGAVDNNNNDDDLDDDVEEMRRANRAKQLRKQQEQNVRGGGGIKKKGIHNRRGR